MYDAIVVGGGPAGLQAALTLGRVHRRVLLVDSGEYRNATAEHAHNLIGADGMPPAELRERARRELGAYPTVEVRDGRVTAIDGERGAFTTVLADGSREDAAAVVLATGVRDELPAVEGLAAQWGRRVAHCPFCHGHEFAGREVALLAPDPARAAHVAGLLRPITPHIVVVEELSRVAEHGDGLRLTLPDGSERDVAGLFVGPVSHPAPLVDALGLERGPSGAVVIDPMGRTSRPGVYAAGDTAHVRDLPGPLQSIAHAIGAGAAAGAAVVGDALLPA